MWTHSGIILDVRGKRMTVLSNDHEEIDIFSGDYGHLHECYFDEVNEFIEGDGFYMVIVGYGGFMDYRSPHPGSIIYCGKKISDLDWLSPQEMDKLTLPNR